MLYASRSRSSKTGHMRNSSPNAVNNFDGQIRPINSPISRTTLASRPLHGLIDRAEIRTTVGRESCVKHVADLSLER